MNPSTINDQLSTSIEPTSHRNCAANVQVAPPSSIADAGDSSLNLSSAPVSPSGAENFARALLLKMAEGNCDTAKGFLQIGKLELARTHLQGALEQIGQAEAETPKSQSQIRNQKVIEV